jgi:hypothetical protein
MKRMRVAGVAFAAAISMLGCSSSDTVVAANVQSSNDAEWNGTTNNGRNGGLISPGIPANILSPGSTDTTKKQAVLVRITLDQPGQTRFFRDVKPKEGGYELNRLDENGNPIPDPAMPMNNLKDKFVTIAAFYERFILPDGWKDGEATMTAEALDASNNVLLSASSKFTVVENEAAYVGVDLKIPDPPKPPEGMGGMAAMGGMTSTGGAAGEATGGANTATGGTASGGGGAAGGGAGGAGG